MGTRLVQKPLQSRKGVERVVRGTLGSGWHIRGAKRTPIPKANHPSSLDPFGECIWACSGAETSEKPGLSIQRWAPVAMQQQSRPGSTRALEKLILGCCLCPTAIRGRASRDRLPDPQVKPEDDTCVAPGRKGYEGSSAADTTTKPSARVSRVRRGIWRHVPQHSAARIWRTTHSAGLRSHETQLQTLAIERTRMAEWESGEGNMNGPSRTNRICQLPWGLVIRTSRTGGRSGGLASARDVAMRSLANLERLGPEHWRGQRVERLLRSIRNSKATGLEPEGQMQRNVPAHAVGAQQHPLAIRNTAPALSTPPSASPTAAPAAPVLRLHSTAAAAALPCQRKGNMSSAWLPATGGPFVCVWTQHSGHVQRHPTGRPCRF